MEYLELSDTIDKMRFSFQCHFQLRKAGIRTVEDLLSCDSDKMHNIGEMELKCLDEIYAALDALATGEGNYCLLPEADEQPCQSRNLDEASTTHQEMEDSLQDAIPLNCETDTSSAESAVAAAYQSIDNVPPETILTSYEDDASNDEADKPSTGGDVIVEVRVTEPHQDMPLEVLRQELRQLFPGGYYPPDKLYRILKDQKGWPSSVLQKHRGGLSTIAWLRSIGLEPLETEMQPCADAYSVPSGTPEIIADFFSQSFPRSLLGNVILRADQQKALYDYAREALLRAINSKSYLSDFDSDIVMLETVLLLRGWNEAESDSGPEENAGSTFWEYICDQYAISYDSSTFSSSHEYRLFREGVIKKSTARHHRVMASGGKKYYTTLLTHALAPKDKFEILFEQIYHFYSTDLHYQFIEGDTAFYDFAAVMKKRFAGEAKDASEGLSIRNLQSSSAIKLLFSECPYYMSTVVRDIIRGMDQLVSSGDFAVETYMDVLLGQWYEKRAQNIRVRDRRARQIASADRVETDYSRIKLSYRIQKNKVRLCVPAIRFSGHADDLPKIHVYLSDKCVTSENLRYYDSDFCVTSVKTELELDALLFEQDRDIPLSVVITYNNEEIYRSGDKLCRGALVFDDGGAEIMRLPELGAFFYLLASTQAVVDEDGLANSPQCELLPGKRQLYRVMMGENTTVTVNGINLFPSIVSSGDLHIEIPVLPVKHVAYIYGQQEYQICNASPELLVAVSNNQDRQYRILIDGQQRPLPSFPQTEENAWRVVLPAGPDCHEVQIADNATNYAVYDFKYIVRPDFSVRFDGFYSSFAPGTGSLTVREAGQEAHYPYQPADGEKTMYLPYGEGELLANIPTLLCRLDGACLSPQDFQVKWHKSIPMHTHLTVEPPRGHAVTVRLGSYQSADSQIEIGNVVAGVRQERPIEPFVLQVRKNGGPPTELKLFEIAFAPCFEEAPLLLEGKQLLWCAEDNYIGEHNAEFAVHLYKKSAELAHYTLLDKDEVVEAQFPFGDGVYHYTVTAAETGFFSAPKEIYRGTLIAGNPAVFRFDRKTVVVTDALIKEKKLELNPESGMISALRYLGERPLNGEKLPYPCYEGCLSYKYNGITHMYSDRKRSYKGVDYFQLNPIRLWLINEYTIALRDPDNDGIYINKSWKSITDREPVTYNETAYDTADYYLYRIEEDLSIV